MTTSNSPKLKNDKHLSHFDGWRGLALCMLLLGHFFPVPGIDFGIVGVNLFFVLSGFLMGGLLFEKQEPIPKFYRRRIARILPAHVVFLVVISIFYFATERSFSLSELISALLFLKNYVPPDLGVGHSLMPFGHIWSLSVEEHSYVVLSLVAIFSRKRLFSSASGVGVLVIVTVCFALYYQWLSPPKLAFNQWLRTETAAYGLVATALWVSVGRRLPKMLKYVSVAPILLLIGIALHWWSVPLAFQRIVGVGCFVIAICALAVNRGWFAVLLSWSPLRQLGLWSFSVYLWQQPFYVWMHSDPRVSPVFALALALICGLASYYLIERPVRAYLNSHWGVKAVITEPQFAADTSPALRR